MSGSSTAMITHAGSSCVTLERTSGSAGLATTVSELASGRVATAAEPEPAPVEAVALEPAEGVQLPSGRAAS